MLCESLEKFVDTEMPESILDFLLPELVFDGDLAFSFLSDDLDRCLFFFSFFFFRPSLASLEVERFSFFALLSS